MSGSALLMKVLRGAGAVTAIVGTKGIFLVEAPEEAPPPYLIVYRSSSTDMGLLGGTAKWPEDRITVECVAKRHEDADRLGEVVIPALDVHILPVTLDSVTYEVTITKEGTDIQEAIEDRETGSRIMDFYVRWRR